MTSEEADRRILLSRTTLFNFKKMIEEHQMPRADLALFEDEIRVLEGIAHEHPGKTTKIVVLVMLWVKLREQVTGKVH